MKRRLHLHLSGVVGRLLEEAFLSSKHFVTVGLDYRPRLVLWEVGARRRWRELLVYELGPSIDSSVLDRKCRLIELLNGLVRLKLDHYG